jgi:hypothetical protein
MDTYRGNFVDRDFGDEAPGYEYGEDEAVREAPPSPVGQDERRMQVRAYNHWASLLADRNFPSVEDLDPDALPDFGPYSVLLDFTAGIENPAIHFLGDELAAECGAGEGIETLDDVPSRSLLSRITDHYMQILANQAPIGFEAEFVNQREKTILYRGILLPFSSDDDTIDFIYGVINWKEMIDQKATDALLLEVDEALDLPSISEPRQADEMLPDWADGPVDSLAGGLADGEMSAPRDADEDANVLDLGQFDDRAEDPYQLPEPGFGVAPVDAEDASDGDRLLADSPFAVPEDEYEGGDGEVLDGADQGMFGSLTGHLGAEPLFAPKKQALTFPAREDVEVAAETPLELENYLDPSQTNGFEAAPLELNPAFEACGTDMGLADWLASARELAEAAQGSEDRTRHALYAAIGRAYDFSLAAAEAPEEFAELVADSGLAVQDRAPLLPVVKLVFGADYDKTRLTEYATALGHAHRLGLARGALSDYLGSATGGLKGVIAEERRFKQGDLAPAAPRTELRASLAKQLRKLDGHGLDAVPAEGSEFTLLVARRLPTGEVVLLGEVADDLALLEKAAKKLVSN